MTVGDRDGDPAGLYVANDGSGLPDGIDNPFERGRSGEADGTGIGLTIVQRVVEAHGWAVRAGESRTGSARFDIDT